MALDSLQDDLHLVVVTDCSAGGDHSGDLQLCGAVLYDGGVYLGVGRLLDPPAPGEHLVRPRVVDSDDPGAGLTARLDGLTVAVVEDAGTKPHHVLPLHHMLEHHHRLGEARSLGLAMLCQQVWVGILTVLVSEEVFRRPEIVWSVNVWSADDSPQLNKDLGCATLGGKQALF